MWHPKNQKRPSDLPEQNTQDETIHKSLKIEKIDEKANALCDHELIANEIIDFTANQETPNHAIFQTLIDTIF
ncbi:hypothetical protein BpHYR1_050775 [Brachionus plicatilis]|uniref:Uncharacterized protein n=1 Tax=Brachionus plicatilis TaxID=10195 RepID=A0A3M7P9K4_BRAPC|nr:hypothetical protein BpHYR1_050775 [Brachionus plicatilis]